MRPPSSAHVQTLKKNVNSMDTIFSAAMGVHPWTLFYSWKLASLYCVLFYSAVIWQIDHVNQRPALPLSAGMSRLYLLAVESKEFLQRLDDFQGSRMHHALECSLFIFKEVFCSSVFVGSRSFQVSPWCFSALCNFDKTVLLMDSNY